MRKGTFFYLAAAVIILVGLFLILKPKASPVSAPSSSKQATSTSSGTASAQPSNQKVFNLTVKNKKLTGSNTLEAAEGDEITFNVTSDVSEELHLHGYNKHIDLEKGKTVQLKFTANLTGRFPFELEQDKIELGALEVQPK